MNISTIETIKIKELDVDIIPPSTADFKDPEKGGSKIVVVGKPGCFIEGTPVLMYDGTIKRVENVIEGDLIMGPDSNARKVLELCRNSDEMFKVIPLKGESYTVNLQHKLVLKSKFCKYKDIEISVDDFLKKPKKWQKKWCVFRTSVEFPKQKVLFDPYNFGFCIANSDTNTETKSNENVMASLEYFAQINNISIKNSELLAHLISSQEEGTDMIPLLNFLRDNNLFENKNIPQVYKANDRNTRLKLLAGIIDKNAYYDKASCNYVIIQNNESLCDDIIFISRSLGFSTEKRHLTKSYSNGKLITESYYSIYISGNIQEIPSRVFSNQNIRVKNYDRHLISSFRLESQGYGNYYGFTIDGDHRFLLGSFDVVRNTGKSTLIGSLLYAKKHIFPAGIAFSGTEDSNHFYRSVMPSTFVFNSYDEIQLEKFIKRQKLAKDHLDNPWAVVILDDCTDDPALFRKPLQNGMYKRGRHWKMWYILSLQYGMDVRPVIRTNIDGVFILREPNMRNRRIMYENYASIIPDFKLFCDIMDQITNDYTALYIHNAKQTNNWQDCVFWYKAKPVPKDFKFGSEDYWNFHYQRYNPEYVDPITV